MFVNQSHVPVVGMTGAVGIMTESEQIGELLHAGIGMMIIGEVRTGDMGNR